MAIKNYVMRGIGASPGKIAFFVTGGLLGASVVSTIYHMWRNRRRHWGI